MSLLGAEDRTGELKKKPPYDNEQRRTGNPVAPRVDPLTSKEGPSGGMTFDLIMVSVNQTTEDTDLNYKRCGKNSVLSLGPEDDRGQRYSAHRDEGSVPP